MVAERARTYCYSVKKPYGRNTTLYSTLLCVITPAKIYGRPKKQREMDWQLVASYFTIKFTFVYSVKYFLVLWGLWVHLESSRKQKSVYTLVGTLRSRDFNGNYYNFINQVISMLERKLDISIPTRPILTL